jgi:[acyl-carrier-protein] S-malonyltransferase
MDPIVLARSLPATALAFRGYNVANLGRSYELLSHGAYTATVERHLSEMSQAASDMLLRQVDLVHRVRERIETSLDTYGDAIALILAMQAAQLALLKEHFGIDAAGANFSFGYSLGEIAALAAGGVLDWKEAMHIPLALSADCVQLAHDVTLGVLFTRSAELPLDAIRRAVLRINHEARGVMGISSYLAPNSLILLGQGDTLDRFVNLAKQETTVRFYLRKNEHRWPPLHTPIVWQRFIPDRAADRMHTLAINLVAPRPRVLSLVTGLFSYVDNNARDLLRRWVDHPQRLWDAVETSLSSGITTLIHVGPDPNLILATFRRMSENVQAQLNDSLPLRALSTANRTWLKRLLPHRASLLRAPNLHHIVLEDWLLEHAPR